MTYPLSACLLWAGTFTCFGWWKSLLHINNYRLEQILQTCYCPSQLSAFASRLQSQPPSVLRNNALFIHSGVMPTEKMLRELYWVAQCLLVRAPNVGMGNFTCKPWMALHVDALCSWYSWLFRLRHGHFLYVSFLMSHFFLRSFSRP